MTNHSIVADGISKKFSRSLAGGLWHGFSDGVRSVCRLPPLQGLRKSEFWALQEISFELPRGACLGIIGPNGAGKTTLLKIIDRSHRPDRGRLMTTGSIATLNRSSGQSQAMFSGRENLNILCSQAGVAPNKIPGLVEEIIEFAGLHAAIDAPVKTYSDGMFARLEFAVAACMPPDILLIDELLAVSDIAFQIRCLERINRLKQQGVTIVFVSHSEMNIRFVADRCLLLLEGRQTGFGEVDPLFRQYYQSLGFYDEKLKSEAALREVHGDTEGPIRIASLKTVDAGLPEDGSFTANLEFEAEQDFSDVEVHLEIGTPTHLLLASAVSGRLNIPRGPGRVRIEIPTPNLAPGLYRISAGMSVSGQFLAFRRNLSDLHIKPAVGNTTDGLLKLPASFFLESRH
jgi:ABC-type polysaccharide/polyol phosphate transport system ATPase subunit